MVGRDTPEPIRSGRPCKTSHGAGCGQRTENPPALAVGSVKSIGLVCAMCMALMSVSVAAAAEGEVPQAANSVSGSTASGAHEVVIEGEPGDIIVVGDLVFEIIDPEEMEELASQPVPYASTTRWTNVSLSGTEMSKKFEVTSSYPYAKVWISNQGKGDIQFTITRGSDTGTLVSGSDVTIKAGTSTSVYSTNSWPADAYYANFTCGSANMKGLTSCRVASTQHELDI